MQQRINVIDQSSVPQTHRKGSPREIPLIISDISNQQSHSSNVFVLSQSDSIKDALLC